MDPAHGGDAVVGDGWVIDCPPEWRGRGVVFLAHLGAVTDLGYRIMLRIEVVGQLGLQLPDHVD